MTHIESEFARMKLAQWGYYDELTQTYEFGEADSHTLRALYLIALSLTEIPLEDLRDELRIQESEDITRDGLWREPPWKTKDTTG